MNTLTYNESYSKYYEEYSDIEIKMISFIQNLEARIFDNPDANDVIQELYRNLTNSNFCSNVIGTPAYYKNCLTCFNGASNLGFASFYKATYDFQMLLIEQFKEQPTRDMVTYLLDSELFEQLNNNGPTADAVFVNNIQVEGEFLHDYCMNIEQELMWIIIIGLIMVFLLGLVVWRPILSRMETQFMHIRQIFSQLPAEIIVHNNYIKNILKNDSGSI